MPKLLRRVEVINSWEKLSGNLEKTNVLHIIVYILRLFLRHYQDIQINILLPSAPIPQGRKV